MAIFGWSCSASGQSNYTQDMMLESFVTGDTLNVSVMRETAHFLAGANIIEETDTEILLKLVRCKLNKKCQVDVSAAYDSQTGHHKLVVPVKDVSLKFSKKVRVKVPRLN